MAVSQARRRKAFLWKLFNSTGFTALLSVVVGGLFAQWINYVAQAALKERELGIAMLQERSKQAQLTHEANLKQQQELIQKALACIGNVISSSENLLSITRPEWEFTKVQWSRSRSYRGAEDRHSAQL